MRGGVQDKLSAEENRQLSVFSIITGVFPFMQSQKEREGEREISRYI